LRPSRTLAVLALTLVSTLPLCAQTALGPDEKELAAYRLTVPTMNKVVAAMRTMMKEMATDPAHQRMMKLEDEIESVEAQIEKLNEKDELTKADEARSESLSAQLEKLRMQKEQMEESESGNNAMQGANTLTEMEQGIRKTPVFARALQREGLAPREYAKFIIAMLQAGTIYGMSQGKVDYARLPAGVNPENVKFIGEHQSDLEAMQKEFEAMGKRNRQ
jgi:DNA repair exonuclease SbcCD ATPase subunit